MSKEARIMGIGCTTVALCVALLVARDMPQVWGPLIGILAGLLGVPLVVNAIRRRLGLEIDEGMKLTWDEWHMIVSGWGDSAAFNKAEKIPNLEEINKGRNSDCDFYAILAREAWYYKFGMGLGKLTWALIAAALLIRFIPC